MSTRAWQAVGVVVAGLASAGAAVVTNVLTERWTWSLWMGLAALLVVGLGGQLLALRSPGTGSRGGVRGGGAGSVVVVGNNSAPITTRVVQPYGEPPSSPEAAAGEDDDGLR